jgi:hypothetical protein
MPYFIIVMTRNTGRVISFLTTGKYRICIEKWLMGLSPVYNRCLCAEFKNKRKSESIHKIIVHKQKIFIISIR